MAFCRRPKHGAQQENPEIDRFKRLDPRRVSGQPKQTFPEERQARQQDAGGQRQIDPLPESASDPLGRCAPTYCATKVLVNSTTPMKKHMNMKASEPAGTAAASVSSA